MALLAAESRQILMREHKYLCDQVEALQTSLGPDVLRLCTQEQAKSAIRLIDGIKHHRDALYDFLMVHL